jgi:hypothetical protein
LLIVLIVRPSGITGGTEVADWFVRRKAPKASAS